MKMKTKKLISLLLALLTIGLCSFSLAACGESDEKDASVAYTHEELAGMYTSYAVEIIAGSKEGTGIVLRADGSEAIIATCYHVTGYDASKVTMRFSGDVEPVDYEIETIGYDKGFDLAFFKVKNAFTSRSIDFLRGERVLDDSKPVGMGKAVTVIGNAFGDGISAFDGIVSLPETVELIEGYYKPLIRITAAVNSGSSGAPVFDDEGNLIGMGQGRRADGEGAGYILPASIMIKLASYAAETPRNAELDRAAIRFEKNDARLSGSYAVAKINVGESSYYYSPGTLTLNGAEVRLEVNGSPANMTLAGVTNAFLELYREEN